MCGIDWERVVWGHGTMFTVRKVVTGGYWSDGLGGPGEGRYVPRETAYRVALRGRVVARHLTRKAALSACEKLGRRFLGQRREVGLCGGQGSRNVAMLGESGGTRCASGLLSVTQLSGG